MSDNKLKTYVSPNKAIVSALSPILPIAHLQYEGTANTYAIFSHREPDRLGDWIRQEQGR